MENTEYIDAPPFNPTDEAVDHFMRKPKDKTLPAKNKYVADESSMQRLADVLMETTKRIPRYSAIEPGAATLIEETRAVTAITDRETYDLVIGIYLPDLQTQRKRAEGHYAPYKKPFHAAHGAVCDLEREDAGAAADEIERLKRLCAQSEFAERTWVITEIDVMKLAQAACDDPRYRKYFENEKVEAAIEGLLKKQLAADGQYFSAPGVTIQQFGRTGPVRQSKE